MRDAPQRTLNYLGPMDSRPFIDVNDFSLNRLDLEPHSLTVENARPLATSLAEEGFILVRQNLPEADWNSPASLINDYLPAINRLVQDITGADTVLGTDEPIVRKASLREEGVRPAPFIHTDFTELGARNLLDRSGTHGTAQLSAALMDQDPKSSHYRRAIIVQSWRVITPPPQDVPLAICAANTVANADMVAGDFVIRFQDQPEIRSETAFYRPNPAHRWYYFADMQPDEVLLFMGYDFFNPTGTRVPHTGFKDRTCPPDATGRISVEARTVALFNA